MKKFKAFISVLTALMICAMPCIPAFAQTYETPDDIVIDESITEEATDEIIGEETTDEITDGNEPVATISLCTAIYVWPISGHTWIYVHNNSDEPIKVGHYEVPVGEGVSVGVFSFSVNDGWGLYYNVEAYKENTKNRAHKVWSISEDISAEQVEQLSDKLINYPNYWGFGGNCATFAFTIWDSVTGDFYFSLLIPAITQIMMIIGGAKRGVLEMYCPPRDHVYRQKGWGENAYLVVASDYTVS